MVFKISLIIILNLSLLSCRSNNCNFEKNDYNKKKSQKEQSLIIPDPQDSIYKFIKSIPVPENYKRVEIDSNTYAFFLRNLSLKPENTVYLYNGNKKSNQKAQYAVVDIDVGTKDLQQCADAVMRLRGEYLYSQEKYSDIHFNFLSDGKPRYFDNYAEGDYSYKKFRKYMDYIFTYANTGSLLNELQTIDLTEMQIGDVFIQKGNPYGHAVTVVDMAENIKTGEKIFMIVQSYMPAQDIHLLKNNSNEDFSPWYSLNFGENLYTPEWTFTKNDLRRFK
jgi:hypothetical protein